MTDDDYFKITALLRKPHMGRAMEVIELINMTMLSKGQEFSDLPKKKAAEKILDFADERNDAGALYLEAVAAWVDSPADLLPVLQRTRKHSLLKRLDELTAQRLNEGTLAGLRLTPLVLRHLPETSTVLRERRLDRELPKATPTTKRPRF